MQVDVVECECGHRAEVTFHDIDEQWVCPECKRSYFVELDENDHERDWQYHFWLRPSEEPPKQKAIQYMDFSDALKCIKRGQRVARAGWNGKGMFIFLVPGSKFTVNREPLLSMLGEGTEVSYHAHVDMKTADGQIVPWLCSQSDMLSSDWTVV
jgi:hypothetical protein